MDIKDKVIIVTGASQGIGLAAVKELVSQGATVVAAARSADLLKNLETEFPDRVLAVVTDMRKKEDVQNLIAKTVEKYGRVDVIVNNAGQSVVGNIEGLDVEDYKKIIELNLYGVLYAMQAVIPQMRSQGGGMILNVSSGLSKRYVPGLGGYASTKHALNALTYTARQELEKDHIIVSAILPKLTQTNFGKNAIGTRADWTGRGDMKIDTAEDVAKKICEIITTEEQELEM